MDLITKLLKVDTEKAAERETKKIHSKRLSKLLGVDTDITIRELSGRQINEINQLAYKKDGTRDAGKLYDLNLMYCVYGVAEPDLGDKALKEHFGASTPKELAEKLFGVESATIASAIVELSGLSDEDEETVKN